MIAIKTSNIKVDSMLFDQMEDTHAQKPDSQGLKGCHILHITTANNVEICFCETKGYGATSVLFQPPQGYGRNILFHDNKGTWERQVNQYYDATIFNTDGVEGEIYNNEALSTHNANVVDWKAESGIEIHFTRGKCYNNKVTNCVNGIIHVAYPMQYTTYDASLEGLMDIYENTFTDILRGVICWGAHIINVDTKNVKIRSNTIYLKAQKMSDLDPDQYYKPVMGVGLIDGSNTPSLYCKFKDIEITNNIIKYYNPSNIVLDYGTPAEQLGAIYLMTNNTCENILIQGNDIDFPYNTFQIRALQDKRVHEHKDITIKDNILLNPAYCHGWAAIPTEFNAVYNYEHVDTVIVSNNAITGTPIELRHDGANVTNISD